MNSQYHAFSKYELRDYQKEALVKLRQFFGEWIKGILEKNERYYEDIEGEIHKVKYKTAALIHMATGSGKTLTVGSFLDSLYVLKERFSRLHTYSNIPPLKILVLSDKIDITNQMKQSFIDGNTSKGLPAILSDTFKNSLSIEKNHSKTKINEILQTSGVGILENEIVFSTFQTAKENIDIQRQFNIILIDEAHHLSAETYQEIFQKFYKPIGVLGESKLPFVLCMTATATDSLKALTGEAIVDFSLPHFLSSKYAPKVEYHTITNHSISKKQTEKIQSKLKYIKNIKKHSKKKSEVKYLANMLNNVLSEIDSDDVLITDLKSRIENIQEEKTIIFVPSIQKANEIEHKINALYDHKNLSIAYHSETKHKGVMENFSMPSGYPKISIHQPSWWF